MRFSRFPTLLTASLLIMLVVSPLLATGTLQPTPAAAQDAPDSEFNPSIYDSSIGPAFTLPQWTDSRWDGPGYYSTIQTADLDGDGADELLARGYEGMIIESWNSTLGLWETTGTGGPFSNPSGWGHAEYYSTIQTADIDGDGSDEVLGRSSGGIDTYSVTWDATSGTWTWKLLLASVPAFSDFAGWDHAEYYSTIQTGDIDGDGADELLARSGSGIDTYKWENSTWTLLKSATPALSDDGGWGKADLYSTIQTGDINGDGAAELLARAKTGIYTYKWEDSTWKTLKASSPAMSDKEGWDKAELYSTIQTGDIDGDKAAELIARDHSGIIVYSWTGGGWLLQSKDTPVWSNKNGWDSAENYSTIQTADIDGDGAAEILGRGDEGISTYKWKSGSWTHLASSNPKLSDAHWKDAENYSTIQTGDIDGDKAADLIARGLYGIRTWSYDKVTPNAWDNPVAYGFTAFTGVEADAYTYVNQFLTIASGNTVRGQYTTDANTLDNYQQCLYTGGSNNKWNDWTALPTETCEKLGSQSPITPPSGLTLTTWNTVAEQIYDELGQAQSVTDYYSDLLTLYTSIYSDDKNILDSTAKTLYAEDMNEKKVDAVFEDLFLATFKLAALGGPIASAVGGTLSALISAGLTAAGSDSFDGKWADAQTKFTELTEKNKDQINDSHAFVAGDASLLIYVADQKTSGNWDPADEWVTRSMTSEGRKNFALWTYRTLSPAVWKLNIVLWYRNSDCSKPDDEIYNYYVDDNKHGDCYREIVKRDFFSPPAPSKQLKNIMDPVSSACTPTMSNSATWELLTCNVGVAKEDFFLNRDGWKFHTILTCMGCPQGPPGMDVSPGDADNTINLNNPGSVSVAILGSADYDAQTTIINSLEFAGAVPVGWWTTLDYWDPSRVKDINDDGYLDVVAAFAISDLNLTAQDTTAVLWGEAPNNRFRLEAPVEVLPLRQ